MPSFNYALNGNFVVVLMRGGTLRDASSRSNTIAAALGDGYGAFALYDGAVSIAPDR